MEHDERHAATPHRLAVVASTPKLQKAVLVERDGLKVVRLIVPDGIEVPEHHSNVDVVVTVVRGAGRFTVSGVTRAIAVGDIVEMAPRVRHSLRAEHELELIVVHARVTEAGGPAHCEA